jgi:hypothetical protein
VTGGSRARPGKKTGRVVVFHLRRMQASGKYIGADLVKIGNRCTRFLGTTIFFFRENILEYHCINLAMSDIQGENWSFF